MGKTVRRKWFWTWPYNQRWSRAEDGTVLRSWQEQATVVLKLRPEDVDSVLAERAAQGWVEVSREQKTKLVHVTIKGVRYRRDWEPPPDWAKVVLKDFRKTTDVQVRAKWADGGSWWLRVRDYDGDERYCDALGVARRCSSYGDRPPSCDVCVRRDMPLWDQWETFIHELAHVVAIDEYGHGPRWEHALIQLHKRYEMPESFLDGGSMFEDVAIAA